MPGSHVVMQQTLIRGGVGTSKSGLYQAVEPVPVYHPETQQLPPPTERSLFNFTFISLFMSRINILNFPVGLHKQQGNFCGMQRRERHV